MTARRNPGLAGVGGVTAADVEALDQGRTTLQAIADRVGCSRQAISRKVRSMRSTSSTGPSTAPSAAASPPSSTSPTVASIPAGAVLIDVQQAIVSANLGIISRVGSLLESGDVLGPSAIKALSAAVSVARSELEALGVLAPDDADATLSVLTVRTMSDQEHDATKAAAELLNEFD